VVFVKSLVRKNKTPLPLGTFGLPYIGKTLAYLRACKANKVFEVFINPGVVKYGQCRNPTLKKM